MANLLDWLGDVFGGGGAPTYGAGMTGDSNPAGDFGGPPQVPGPQSAMPPVQQTGDDQVPKAPDMATEPNPTAGFGGARATQPPVPLPQPRPAGAPQAAAPVAPPSPAPAPAPSAAPGPPMNIQPTTAQPAQMPGQTWLGRALGITPDQAGGQGRQISAGLAAGLKAIGSGAGVGQGKFAAFAGGMGNAMEGAQKEAAVQSKQASDYLNSAIKARQAGDEAGYKRSYLKYLAAKLQADTDKAASKDATNKNDTPTQLYLNAQRLVQGDPEVKDASKALTEARKNGTPDEVAKAQEHLNQIMAAKQSQHYGALGLNPATAAELGKQPGNSIQNPIDASKQGITKDNIAKKLQPGQYFVNPSDGKVYQYKGDQKGQSKGTEKGGMPDKPTNPEPVNPMKPYKTPLDSGSDGGGDED